MDQVARSNRLAWEVASQKYVEESEAFLAAAQSSSMLLVEELDLLAPLLLHRPLVVHLQSGHGLDDVDLATGGASFVLGVDFSTIVCGAATTQALAVPCAAAYVVADVLETPLRDASADLVYTGKGALVWLTDLAAWADEVARILKPGGHLFAYEQHPAAALWTIDEDAPRLRPEVSYFGGTRPNDSFPASAIERFGDDDTPAAIETQWTLSAIVMALIGAGLTVTHIGEHAEPFWRPAGSNAAAWTGSLPNSFSLLARKPHANM